MSSDAVRVTSGLGPVRWSTVIRALDPRVLVPALVLCAVGLVALAADRPEAAASQARWIAVGVAACLAVIVIPYRRLLDLIYPVYALAIVALVLVVAGFGVERNFATRWLQLGPVGFQPSEVAKVAVVAALARYIRFRRDHRTFRGLLEPFLLTQLPLALIVMQPDLGTALMLPPILFVMLWAAGARSKHLLAVVLLGVAAIPLLWTFVIRDYQKARVLGFVHPAVEIVQDVRERVGLAPAAQADPTPEEAPARRLQEQQGAARRFPFERSLAAIASGHVSGAGFRQGAANRTDYVPESWTDFIFTVHAEEWGFLGVLGLLGLEAALLLGLATVAREVKEPAARLLAVGGMTLLGTQAFVNLAMTLGVAPVTGLPLPFLSYGGTSMVSSWLVLGLALNARAHRPLVFTERDFD